VMWLEFRRVLFRSPLFSSFPPILVCIFWRLGQRYLARSKRASSSQSGAKIGGRVMARSNS